jgi:hypothetical protein
MITMDMNTERTELEQVKVTRGRKSLGDQVGLKGSETFPKRP